MTGSCLWGSVRSAHNVGGFGVGGRCMTGSSWSPSAIVGRNPSVRVV